jgi:DNA-binding beta-propeller fold protein YncE
MAIGPGSTGYVPTADSVLTVDLVRRQVVGTFTRGAYYGAAVEEVSGDVYLSDVQQYAGPGKIVVFSSGGQYRTQFPVGLIPGSMAFKR